MMMRLHLDTTSRSTLGPLEMNNDPLRKSSLLWVVGYLDFFFFFFGLAYLVKEAIRVGSSRER